MQDAQIAAVRARAQRREVQPRGECLFCGDDFEEPQGQYKRLYCDDFCRGKHQRALLQARYTARENT